MRVCVYASRTDFQFVCLSCSFYATQYVKIYVIKKVVLFFFFFVCLFFFVSNIQIAKKIWLICYSAKRIRKCSVRTIIIIIKFWNTFSHVVFFEHFFFRSNFGHSPYASAPKWFFVYFSYIFFSFILSCSLRNYNGKEEVMPKTKL